MLMAAEAISVWESLGYVSSTRMYLNGVTLGTDSAILPTDRKNKTQRYSRKHIFSKFPSVIFFRKNSTNFCNDKLFRTMLGGGSKMTERYYVILIAMISSLLEKIYHWIS